MVLNAIQKQSSKQSLHKVILEAAVRKFFPMNIAKFLWKFFYRKPPVAALFQFDKVIVQHWASVDLFFLIRNTIWDGFH